ncbi:phasin family protein [Caldovatus aquaticus]|uniref:TIGR01841 family phasin n=1 Tax=Caldovatus aquaticus TaxID=2865671 RepID=A0ABS7F4W6_9PROT|nr:TIGR01841 family phasin [Caldovatus aquaticus]MBW8270660.1 TIGR01841 family phasin [Caldovatus aquaticus]
MASDKTAEVKKLSVEAATATAAGAHQARKLIEDGAAQARATVEKSMEQATKAAEGLFKVANEAVEFGRGNLEAVAKSAQTWTVGVQDLSRQTFAVVQSLTDQALENAKALIAAKSLKEAADLQANFARSALERALSEAARLQEASFRLAEQATAPLAARATLAFEKFGRPLAA